MEENEITRLFGLLYNALRDGNTLEHEACIKLVGEAQAIWEERE